MNLLVIKTQKLDECLKFYQTLGLTFVEEKHGDGPTHYSCTMGELVFEIYPTQRVIMRDAVRLGFKVKSAIDIAHKLDLPYACEKPDGFIVDDPDGRRIHLTEVDMQG